MVVRSHLGGGESDVFVADGFAQDIVVKSRTLAGADDVAAAQIGKGEVGLTVAAVGRSENGEQRGVL